MRQFTSVGVETKHLSQFEKNVYIKLQKLYDKAKKRKTIISESSPQKIILGFGEKG